MWIAVGNYTVKSRCYNIGEPINGTIEVIKYHSLFEH